MPRGHVIADGSRLAALRGEAGLTQKDLARLAGYGLRTISKIEAGRPTGAATLAAVATVLTRTLCRRIDAPDLCPGCSEASRDRSSPALAEGFLLAEAIKILDFRRPGPERGRGQPAVLTDRQRFHRIPDGLREMVFPYATSGMRMSGRSLSQPYCAEWAPVTDFGTIAARESHLASCYALRVRMDNPPAREFLNEVVYEDGFSGKQGEWFHTHVVYPTESLTFLVWFPEDKPFRAVRGLTRRHPAEPFRPTPEQPMGVPSGQSAYWRVAWPRPGEVYQIEWNW